MQGQLFETDLPSLLKQIALAQKTGELWIETPGLGPWQTPMPLGQGTENGLVACHWLVSFFQGKLLHASRWGDRTQRLQDCLQRLAIALPGLRSSADGSPSPHPNLHQSPEYELLWNLLEQKHISPEQAGAIARQLSEETLFELANLPQGCFTFLAATHPIPHFTALPTLALLQRLERKCLQWQKLYPTIRSLDQCPLLLDGSALEAHLPSQSRLALSQWAQGETSLLRLARHLNRHPVSIALAIHPYLQAGFVKLCPASASRLPSWAAAVRPGDRPAQGQPPAPTIACIDEDPERLSSLRQTLTAEGYGVRCYGEAIAALAALAQQPPDLVLCHLKLPDLSGDQLCAMWRQIPKFRQVPIILTLATPDFPHRLRIQAAQATDYLQRPWERDELLMLLGKYIRPVPSLRPLLPQVWQADALQGKLGHDSGEAKLTSKN